MKKTKENSESYNWGENCMGWHLVKSKKLSVIQEIMPPKAKEKNHYHLKSEQFFMILSGKATFEIEDRIIEIEKGFGIHILPNINHKITNYQSDNLEFLLISTPPVLNDRCNTDIS